MNKLFIFPNYFTHLADDVANGDGSVNVCENEFCVLFEEIDEESDFHVQGGNSVHGQVATGLQVERFPFLERKVKVISSCLTRNQSNLS